MKKDSQISLHVIQMLEQLCKPKLVMFSLNRFEKKKDNKTMLPVFTENRYVFYYKINKKKHTLLSPRELCCAHVPQTAL